MANNNVIFIHPDGTSPSHFGAGRFIQEGPDGRLNWDEMTNAGVYLGHIKDQVVSTSNAGAVVHSHGTKPYAGSYGLDENGNPVESLSYLAGRVNEPGLTIMEEAINAGKATAVINSGFIAEPGTGVFLAAAESRSDVAEITKQIVESGVDIIMGGGEIHYLPEGTVGRFGEEGIRTDGRNLIEEAQENGYTVVYTREELENLSDDADKVLGIFAAEDTYNDTTEEANIEAGLDSYGQPGNENPPTVGEMLAASLPILNRDEDGFFVVLEEEGTDNFPNNNNSRGFIEALLRADQAIGVAQDFIDNTDPNTLLVTAADSDAGGLEVIDTDSDEVGTIPVQPTLADRSDAIEAPLDGRNGRTTEPFISAPNEDGEQFPFGIGYAGTPDFEGSIVAKTYGLNAEQLPPTVDNTGIYEIMYETLFDTELPSYVDAPEADPAPQATQPTGNVIFIHPDGTSPAHYAAGRFIEKGPDGRLNWDMMSDAGVYLGHIDDQIVSTSNAGAVVHAFGTKPYAGSYGLDEAGNPIVSLSGKPGTTIMEEAIEAGKAVAVINSGFIAEPGTGVFLSDAENRGDVAEITEEIVTSGAEVILGGGEIHYLPQGTVGRFGEEGIREDGRNLIEEAQELGYTVVYTREELENLGEDTEKVLGIFAAEDTYNDTTEEANIEAGLDNYGQPGNENPPTVGEMLAAALPIVSKDEDGFFVVLEEEATDNFGNNNNSRGVIEAVLRADEAIGVAMDYIENQDPNTLLLTAADSDAGGLQVIDQDGETVGTVPVNPTLPSGEDAVEVPLDGQNGRNTEPFVSAPATNPAADGETYTFGVGYVGTPDFAGSIVSKAHGLNADQLPPTADNTDMYRLMYQTLFGVEPEEVAEQESNLVSGTSEDDTLIPGISENFNGLNNTVFTGAGNDEIDLAFGGNNNRVNAGSGDDVIYVGNQNRVFGGAGNDEFEATDSIGENRMSGGEGNDIFYLGMNDRALGGAGDDKFFVQSGGDNILSGGMGADQFWIVSAELPEAANTIIDFEIGTDVIGILGSASLGIDASTLELNVVDGNTEIGFAGNTLAMLNGVTGLDVNTSVVFA
ncbi:alkaline phosphatase [Plectonema cf. radiosum LEGE 06105]|uniref:Alkaline phosphatase n=1 Tax=Plectonema cf. radiosum LEGE 06105 TaxID=945769 RepID=A0A8J7JZR1_9CYAN|nr:alkaline phosphatase [Plectonema radiosum]MBE9212791.1 alkaline phosphatase [Plectonema cf. radiosum LEGE 06105]